MTFAENQDEQNAQLRAVQDAIANEHVSYAALFEQSNDAVFFIDFNMKHIAVNESACRIFGYSRDELLKLTMRDLVPPEEQNSTEQNLDRMLRGEVMPIYVRSFRHKSGSIFAAEVNVALVRNTHGVPLYVQSVLRDITERRRIEKQEIELSAQREKVAILTQLGRITAHDLRTPLSVINMNLHLITRSTELPFIRERAGRIEEQVHKLNSIIDDLQLISRLEAGLLPHWELLSINNVITHVVEQLDRLRAARQIHIDSVLGSDIPDFESDTYYLAACFLALVENALLYTNAEGTVTIRSWYADKQIHIAIQDTGIGILDEEQAHIFEPFFKGERARRVEGSGAGLGLSIVRRVVEMHGGSIDVTSEVDVGSTFTVHLPQQPFPHTNSEPIL